MDSMGGQLLKAVEEANLEEVSCGFEIRSPCTVSS